MEKVSIVLPFYKAESFIDQTIKSIIDQTYREWELICVDDHSPDRTAEIIEAYIQSEPRIRLIKHPKNMGKPAYGRNTGIKESTGSYLAFIDHDDFWEPTKLAEQMEAIQRDKVDLICCNAFLYNDLTKKDDLAAWGLITGDPKSGFYRRLLVGNFVTGSSVLLRRQILDKIGLFDTQLQGTDDYDLWCRIARQFPCSIIEKPLVHWRYMNNRSISFNDSVMLENELMVYQKILSFPGCSEMENELAKSGVIRCKRRLANQYLLLKQYDKAEKLYFEISLTKVARAVQKAPALVRLAYMSKLKLVNKFSPITLNFSS